MKRRVNNAKIALADKAFPGKAFPGLEESNPSRLRARRGVLLLVVLSLLMLFSLVAVTFVLVSSRHYETTRYAVKNEQTGDDPRDLLDNVFAQCIRGTNDQQSVIGPHGLLEDMYGNDGIVYRQHVLPPTLPTPLAVVAHSTSSLIYDLTFTPMEAIEFTAFPGIDVPPVRTPPYPLIQAQLQAPGYFNGCVFTAIGGVADGRSTRILGWGYTGGQYRIRVMAFESIPLANLQADPPVGFVVNGRPFNGTGFGYDPTNVDPTARTLIGAAQTIQLPSGAISIPSALLPNPKYWNGQSAAASLTVTPPAEYYGFGGIGGADEDYDAPDTQNMLLAHLPLVVGNSSGIIPSLHRPDTYRYLQQQFQDDFNGSVEGNEARRLVLRQSTLRPQSENALRDDHPRFPRIDLSAGPYDVDNDGDGIPESIWVDAGLPVRTAADGRTYKPLVAILCLDLDGRLNVNAHGNIAHVDEYYHSTTAGVSPQAFTNSNLLPSQFLAAATVGPELPRGQGYGPAEVSLLPLFRSLGSPPAPITAAELQAYSRLLATRYSEPNVNLYDWARDVNSQPVYNRMTGFAPVPPQKFGAYPGATAFGDRLAGLMRSTYPDPTDANRRSAFGTPPNLWGRGFVAMDVAGNPLMPYMGVLNDRDDSPYEMNLNRREKRGSLVTTTPATPLTGEATPNPLDTPYTTAELERLLRVYDNDSTGLPERLRRLVNAGGGPPLAVLRNMVTTDSFDLPVPSSLPTREIIGGAANVMISTNVIDLLTEKLRQGGFTGTVALEIPKMLPPEVIAGRKLDLNRPFGNGRDDDLVNGVVDEPGETETSFWFAAGMSVPVPFTVAPYAPNYVFGQDVNLNGTPNELADQQMARQLLARHLYILMMLLKGNEEIDFDGNTGNNTPEETARGIAQWAVNIVDFRDRDSIMTPFHYNIYPFRDGWTANGDLTVAPPAGTAVVWGMERPELLITETLAYHDRRTEDLDDDDLVSPYGDPETMAGRTTDLMDREDQDFDQRLRPFAPFFIELYNPWLTQSSIDPGNNGQPAAVEMPAELYTNPAYRGVKLDALDVETGTSPVWRMLVVANASIGADPDDNGPPAPTVPFIDADVDRTVYFTNPSTIGEFPNAPRYFSDPMHPIAPVLPGRHAVVGSAGLQGLTNTATRTFVSPIGRVQGAGDTASPNNRRIVLNPNPDPNLPQVQILNNNPPASHPEPAISEIQPAVAVALTESLVAGTPASFPDVAAMASISQPFGASAYPATNGTLAGGEPIYTPPRDIPVDTINPYLGGATAPEQPPDGTRPNFRMIHLQRLANPLEPWDVNTNPYLTIDSMSIDCTVFNGVVDPNGPSDPRVPAPPSPIYTNGLATYQRGDIADTVTPPVVRNPALWLSNPLNTLEPAALTPTPGNAHYFDRALQHTLGFLNQAYGRPGDAASTFVSTDPLIQTYNRRSYLGLPKAFPFTWLPWNNRPYANEMELLLVPQMRSSQLAVSYKPLPNQPYQVTTGRGHLPNLWETPASHWAIHGNLHRILDYVHVPSPFVGTEMELPPQDFLNVDPYDAELRMSLLPPFNRISQYREPGKININTIPSDQSSANSGSAIWDGIMNTTAAHNLPTWQEVSASRQGIGTFTLGDYPTRFGNPFRSAGGASYQLPDTDVAIDRDEIEVTFLRPLDPASANETEPLFRYLSTQSTDNPDANPYFRVNTLQRLKNLLTTRSNVYAIWITVGYFEVRPVEPPRPGDPMPPLARHPDGYQLWGEIGSDTGEIKRHRAFYIYDRSIPVAFERGKDHNMADGILLKRFIE